MRGGRTSLPASLSNFLESVDDATIYGGVFTLSFQALGEYTLVSGPATLKTLSAFATLETVDYNYAVGLRMWLTLNLANPVAGWGTASGLFMNSDDARLNGLVRFLCTASGGGHRCLSYHGATTGVTVRFGVGKNVPAGSGTIQAYTHPVPYSRFFYPGTARAVLNGRFSTTSFTGQELNRTFYAPEPGVTPLLLTAAALTAFATTLRRRSR